MLHPLIVVLGNAVGGAQGDTNGVVGGSQINVGDTGPGISGVDDGLAVGPVVNLDTGFDGLLVGGIQRQRHIVEVLLQQLDRPHHTLRAVLLGRSDVDVQIGGAGGNLLGGTLQDGRRIPLVHGLADGRGDAVNPFADGDEGLALGIVALVVNAHVHHFNLGHLGLQQLLEGQLLDFLLGGSGGLGGSFRSSGLGGSLVFLILHVLGQLDSLGGANHDVPVRQLFLNFALHHGHLAGDNQGAGLDLIGNIMLIEKLLDSGGGELAGSPGGQYGHTGSVGNQQVHRAVGALQLAGHQEVGQGEVHRQGAGAVLVGTVERIDLGLDLHGLLGVGVDVLAQAIQRQSLSVGHVLHHDDGGIALGEHSGIGRLQPGIALGDLGQIDDGGVAEAPVAVLQGGPADQHGVGQRFLGVLAGDIQHQILVARCFQLLDGVVQVGQILRPHAQRHAGFGGNFVHFFPVLGGRTVQNGLAVLADVQRRLGAGRIPALQNQRPAGGRCLFHQMGVSRGIIALVGAQNELDVHSLADSLIIDLRHIRQLGVHGGVVHAGAHVHRIQVLVDQSLLVTEQHRFAAQLVILADGDGLHGRCGLLVEDRLRIVREIRALIDGNSALSHLHAECHTGGAAALLTVLLRRQLKNVKTFQSHGNGSSFPIRRVP